jgi:hypothetical protein
MYYWRYGCASRVGSLTPGILAYPHTARDAAVMQACRTPPCAREPGEAQVAGSPRCRDAHFSPRREARGAPLRLGQPWFQSRGGGWRRRKPFSIAPHIESGVGPSRLAHWGGRKHAGGPDAMKSISVDLRIYRSRFGSLLSASFKCTTHR